MSQEVVLRAVRKRRVEVHLDRLKRMPGLSKKELEGIDRVAKEVGEAAWVLGDVEERRRYDRKVAVWEMGLKDGRGKEDEGEGDGAGCEGKRDERWWRAG